MYFLIWIGNDFILQIKVPSRNEETHPRLPVKEIKDTHLYIYFQESSSSNQLLKIFKGAEEMAH